MKLKHQLPSFYENILPRSLLQFEPVEKKATCDNCAMSTENHRGPKFYRPDLKCCTFQPFIPNFLVGGVFNDPSSSKAQETLRYQIENRLYSLPVGMTASVRYQLEFKKNKDEGFGQNENWLCSYYNKENGLCNMWRNRGVVCTTFYCKSSYGKSGMIFWNQLSDYLALIEMALMEEALVMLDFSPRQVSKLITYLDRNEGTKAEQKAHRLPEPLAKELWNGYYHEQEEFFKKSYQIAANLDKKALKEIVGQHGAELEQRLLQQMDLLLKKSRLDMTPKERQEILITEFSKLADWEDRYKKIIELGKTLPEMPEHLKTEQNKVKGCQSQVWLHASLTADKKVIFTGDSDAVLVKGLVALLLRVYSDSNPKDILMTPPEFLKKLGFDGNLSPSRANGLNSMLKQIQLIATAYSMI